MFQKKDIIYNETIGVCQVTEVTKLVDKRGQPIMYYGLKSLQDGRTRIYSRGKSFSCT